MTPGDQPRATKMASLRYSFPPPPPPGEGFIGPNPTPVQNLPGGNILYSMHDDHVTVLDAGIATSLDKRTFAPFGAGPSSHAAPSHQVANKWRSDPLRFFARFLALRTVSLCPVLRADGYRRGLPPALQRVEHGCLAFAEGLHRTVACHAVL